MPVVAQVRTISSRSRVPPLIGDPHHLGHIEGYCSSSYATKITKGTRKPQFCISNCYGYGNNDGHTGWNATSRIMIEEVPPGQ